MADPTPASPGEPGIRASAGGVRARVRAELTSEIKATARRHLSAQGASGLSLRAVARDLGMASSAIYRYFPSRDDLLTALIIDAYDAVGEAAEQADAACRRGDLRGRWMAICRAVRGWAVANPHEYALVFGSPVPGYAAPVDTVQAATRAPNALLALLGDAEESGHLEPPGPEVAIPAAVRHELVGFARAAGLDIPPGALVRGFMGWQLLFGAISFELFGHLHNVIGDTEAFFDHEMERLARYIGLR